MENHDTSLPSYHRDIYEALGDREPSTTLEAAAVLANIREEKGYVDDEVMEDLNSIRDRSREKILRMYEKKREEEAAHTKSVFEQLHSSKYRFLYELIQNADDASYKNAVKENEMPFLKITLYSRQLVIETNEDGFTRANVEAICATGKSSKKASTQDDYIRERGFGFKSIFAVADQVRIQSGIWSFRFEHRQGDQGLGMVTPLETEPETLSSWCTTKITLKLHTEGDRLKSCDAITELPDTTLFFLQRLRKLGIYTRQDDVTVCVLVSKTITKSGLPSSGRVTIESQLRNITTSYRKTEKSVYHVFSHIISKMPSDARRPGRKETEVVLGFPTDAATEQPRISALGQHNFAYLPLQRLPQFQFLVQSGFITSASRETVVDCSWNDAIRDGVVQTFCKAIAEFTTPDDPLRYSWLDYLPSTPTEGLWKPPDTDIKEKLKLMPILQTWGKRAFKCPHSFQRPPPIMLHEGKPILRDLPEEVYLAPEYDEKHHTALEDLGVKCSTWSTMVDCLQADVDKIYPDFKLRSAHDTWHQSFAHMFIMLLQESQASDCVRRLKKLAIIPLGREGKWTTAPRTGSGALSSIYFPSIDGVDIPDDISLNLVERVAASDPKRKAFYSALGVQECPKEIVLSKIEIAHRFNGSGCPPHFKFLFHFHPSPEVVKSWIRVPTEAGQLASTDCPLYFLSNHPYHTQQLLPERFRTESNNIAFFINSTVLDLERSEVRPQGLSYGQWLQRVTGARYHPPLINEKSGAQSKISDVLRAVLEHNPEKFVGTLKMHWSEYKSSLSLVKDELGGCEVPCESGGKNRLEEVWLPTVDIRNLLHSFGAKGSIPLLRLPTILNEKNYWEWLFLEELYVGRKPDIWFYCSILEGFDDTPIDGEILLEMPTPSYESSITVAPTPSVSS
ncbi:hypothetical protein P154DRAFT_574818 [Amniculicola lignicola CBS 123094]|uniref:Uncharacterized protein n=1 Tax=Amniculicola lignicola CBS 123094 TaxID=1392246 RepID=A0A6A5WRU7_9PLEO|nr:hypothetical protein P154DRAFT_574818 [Amniculicola lignicola CBS 123094]